MGIQQIHLNWDQPLLPAVTKRLLEFTKEPITDLSDCMVLVPTGQTARRLREALALASQKEHTSGLFPPRIVTPDALLSLSAARHSVASDDVALAAWASILGHISLEQFEALFPVEPIRSTGWQLGMAQRLQQLRKELGEAGLSIADAAQLAANAGREPERWRQLSRLEGLYLDALRKRSLADTQSIHRSTAKQFQAPDGIQRIILAATPDPLPLTLEALKTASGTTAVEIWSYGPKGLFDEWGRPVTELWQKRSLDLENWGCQIIPKPNPRLTADVVAQQVGDAQPESVLIGLADPELNPLVNATLDSAGIACFDPEGQPLNLGAVGRLTELLCMLDEQNELSTVRSLLQHPDVFNWIQSTTDQSKLLRRLDRVFENHLTADLDALLHFTIDPDLKDALRKLKTIKQQIQQSGFTEGIVSALVDIYSRTEDQPKKFAESVEKIRQLCRNSRETEIHFSKLPTDYRRSALRQRLKSTRTYPERPKDAHDLLGWLELLWNDAPHLILAGLNEGIVPESVVGDAFLPETLRGNLGLRTNGQRFARDAYILEAICRRRANGNGKTDIIIPQTGTDGTPLKPSRILFQGGDDTLLSRTQTLFSEGHDSQKNQRHSFPWTLSPPKNLPSPTSISVSALRSYLECPFRFFLKHILKMRTVDVSSRELTPATFGTLFHDTVSHLEGMTFDDKVPPAELSKKLHSILEREIQQKFGKQLSFALRLQHEALIARLNAFVDRQLNDIHENGCIHISATERPFEMDIEGVTIRGTIDRIDRRNGRIELIDYKTADTPKSPQHAHLKLVGKKPPLEHIPPEAFFDHDGKTYQWTDLQLPLYLLSQETSGSQRPKLAYFNLARTLEKSGMAPWDDFTQSHLESAQACTRAIIRQIKAGIFWPPNTSIRENYDDFASLFPDGIDHSVEAEAFSHYSFK